MRISTSGIYNIDVSASTENNVLTLIFFFTTLLCLKGSHDGKEKDLVLGLSPKDNWALCTVRNLLRSVGGNGFSYPAWCAG